MTLADAFPEAERREYVQRTLKTGLVVKLFCDFITDPKWKRLVIVAVRREPPFFFLINTEPTNYAKRTPRIAAQQLKVLAEDNDYLEHDSWIDCSKPFDDFDMLDIEDALTDDTSLILGEINAETASRIIEIVTDSDTLSPNEINAISMELADLV
ncbi:MAG TPA: hypothetical protein VNG71_19930 [Pyrinomonadaceae bacterium]|nr:hypothetical protein [Pyrinomonadaceae bacterium]